MLIEFRQSGGFAGLIRCCRIDTTALDAIERRRVEALVSQSGLPDAGTAPVAAPRAVTGRDLRQFEILIEHDGQRLGFTGDERSLPAASTPLVAFLREQARPGPAGVPAVPATGTPAALRAAATAGRWGRFEGDIVARWHDDGREMSLVQPFAYVDPEAVRWDAPTGSVVDGASIPRPFWSLIGGPFEGRFRNASVVHDVACVDRRRPWRQVHRMFYDACRCGGVAAVEATMMYYAVQHFGPRWRLDGRTLRDETPAPPTPAEVTAIRDWFATHDVDAVTIPTLVIE